MPVPTYLASLRVFSPLSTFPPGERRRWERYIAAGKALDRAGLVAAEHDQALRALVRPSLDVAEEQAAAEVVDGVTYLCPSRTQLRVWSAAAEFRDGLPALIADSFVPRGLADEAADRLAGWREVSPELRAHIRTAPWAIPLAWFLLFEEAEADRGEDTLRYVAGLGATRRRITQALGVLEQTLPQAPTTGQLADLGRWLAEFHGYSRVELDYGVLAGLFEDLTGETSVADLTEALGALNRADGDTASAAYERVAARWRPLQLRENAS